MLIFSEAEAKEMFKGFSDEQLEEIMWQFTNSLEKQTFRSRRVKEEMLVITRSEFQRRTEENKK